MARSNLELAAAMGKRMAERRKECGLTQENVADLAGITHQQYNKAENGKTCLSSDTLLRVSMQGCISDSLRRMRSKVKVSASVHKGQS